MSEFFKAATKCDVAVAKQAPMSIDQRGVMEELYAHERLIERVLATKDLLDALDREDEEKKRRADTCQGTDAMEELAAEEGDGVAPGSYAPPPLSTVGILPELRPPGGKIVHRQLQERLKEYKQALNDQHDTLVEAEATEHAALEREIQRRKDQAARELNAILVARQEAAQGLKSELTNQRVALEQRRRRVHPIDILQKKIAADLMEEIHEATLLTEHELRESQVGIDSFLEEERLKGLRYNYYSPSKHIPSGFA